MQLLAKCGQHRDTELEDVMLKDFVLTTREIEPLLGSEGKEGLIQQLLKDATRMRALRQAVAASCEERADVQSAVRLYHEVRDSNCSPESVLLSCRLTLLCLVRLVSMSKCCRFSMGLLVP